MILALQALPLLLLIGLLFSGRVAPVPAVLTALAAAIPAAFVSLPGGIALPGFLATYSTYLDDDQQRLVTEFASRVVEWAETAGSGPLTVTHGDYRLDNLMFASPAGGYPVAAVDWQSPGHGPGINDVSYFLGAGLLPEQRRAVERDLVREYAEALRAYDVTIDDDELWRLYACGAYAGVIMTVVASQIVATTDRSEALFEAMGTRHTRHALDLDAASLI